MYAKLYEIRYELFFFSQLAILFGSLVMPVDLFDELVMPALFLLNIFFGLVLVSKKKQLGRVLIVLFLVLLILFGVTFFKQTSNNYLSYTRFTIYFLFYIIISIEIVRQVLKTTSVNRNVIIGLMSGYLSIGLIAFFIFLSIEIYTPDSFKGLLMYGNKFSNKVDSLLYFSYITLLSIGYGDVVPLTPIAQKASVLIGVLGQFYIIIVTTVVVEKYIFHTRNKK
ncbi:ion channel [Cognatitamlana onchidii]|uniref:ion channel n=1 Tax=Cognatitamlana onchidii TaxID=2562860 RepID=UPI001455DF8F|nr:ion channel [Algibacter onchidii]